MVSILINVIPYIIIAIVVIKSINTNAYGTKKLKFSKNAKKLKDVPYFRDIPCDKDIHKAYWVSCHYNLIKNKTDFLGAILLKWLKEKRIENVTVTSSILKKESRAIKLISEDGLDANEIELFNMMKKASVDGVLESNEFVDST